MVIEDQVYPKVIWEYLGDMPYMPSRSDRDKLVRQQNQTRVQIWDYFFRMKPADVGIPIQQEIIMLRKSLEEEIANHTQKMKDTKDSIKSLQTSLTQKRVKSFLYSFLSLSIAFSSLYYMVAKAKSDNILALVISSPFFLYGLIMLVNIGLGGRYEKREIKFLKSQLLELRDKNNQTVKRAVKRIIRLESEIKELIKQIPIPVSDKDIRTWLATDFQNLWEKSKDSTGLGTRLVPIRLDNVDGISAQAENPIPVLGPGELQDPNRIPLSFTKNINPDLNKHLTARRAFYLPEYERYEVVYGMYYIEYILIADDMLATYGFFYDFITGELHSEETTEKYYQDVVEIAMKKEYRLITLGVDSQETIYIENAPTFTMTLASGDHRTVTFVSEKYFLKIKDKIDLTEENVSKIYWIRDSEKVADHAVKALRYYLRLHKGTEE